MRFRQHRLARLTLGLVLLTGLTAGCGDDVADEEDGGASLTAGACVDTSDSDDIVIVDCSSSEATHQVIGTYETGRCPVGTIAIDSTQFLNGREVADGDLSDACAKDVDEITSEDRARIEEILNPTYHGLPLVGTASKLDDGPEPESAECLSQAEEVSGSAAAHLTPVECDSDEAAWKVVELVEGDNGVYEGDDCPTDASAAAAVSGSNPPTILCIVELD